MNKTIVYTYDSGGNITKCTEYPYTTGTLGTATKTINYTYDSAWKDKLISYDGQNITYDAIGNPTNYRGIAMTWNGRKLMSYTKGDDVITYKYDGNGLRTSKTVNGVKHDYYYDEKKQKYIVFNGYGGKEYDSYNDLRKKGRFFLYGFTFD